MLAVKHALDHPINDTDYWREVHSDIWGFFKELSEMADHDHHLSNWNKSVFRNQWDHSKNGQAVYTNKEEFRWK